MAENFVESITQDPDFSTLQSDDEYSCYFRQLVQVFSRLLDCYRHDEKSDCYESQVVAGFLRRLLYTVGVLKVRYAYRPEHTRPLWVDVTESGLPNYSEINKLAADGKRRQEQLRQLPATSILKRSLLDALFEQGTAPLQLLQELCERQYFEMLLPWKLFLPYTPGDLALISENEKARSYSFSWACYDQKTNRAYIHLMTFDQDSGQRPLLEEGKSRDEFDLVLKQEGMYVPDIGILAVALDSAMETIHPKILKRICLGPLYSPILLKGRPSNPQDPREQPLRKLLDTYAKRSEDFVLMFQDDIVFSKRQEITRTLLSPKGKVREIFAFQESDPECYKRRASVIHKHVLLPHHILQHMSASQKTDIPDFKKARTLTFDEQGVIHGI